MYGPQAVDTSQHWPTRQSMRLSVLLLRVMTQWHGPPVLLPQLDRELE